MEIKSQELRSGNLLMGQPFNCARVGYGDGVVAITAYGIGLIESDPNFGKNFKPIEITADWLTRLGFEDCNDPEFNKWASAKMYFNGMIQVGAFRTDQNEIVKYTSYIVRHPTLLNGNPINHINTVHQLQNLYFAVHGEELAIDNKSL